MKLPVTASLEGEIKNKIWPNIWRFNHIEQNIYSSAYNCLSTNFDKIVSFNLYNRSHFLYRIELFTSRFPRICPFLALFFFNYSTNALIDTICWEKTYQLRRISGFSSVFSRKFDKNRKTYQLRYEYCILLRGT